MKYKINELNEKYELELKRILFNIKKSKAKLVLLQFPEGLKLYATSIVDYLRYNTKRVEFLIWLESCYGACDVPVLGEKIEKNIDLIVQFGHNEIMPR